MKRLGLKRSRCIICAADLSDEQAAGLTATHELTFVNLPSLGTHLQTLVLRVAGALSPCQFDS